MTRLIDADSLNGEKFYSHERHEYCVSVYAIDTMPTVEPERPHGNWIKDIPCSDGFHTWYRCSICGAMEKMDGTSKISFCWNCGADMRVKNELNRVSKELNSEIEKSKSEIVPDYRDGWRKRGEAE